MAILFASVSLAGGNSHSSHAVKPIHLATVPLWYWLDDKTRQGMILDWCDYPRAGKDWIPCNVRVLRNYPVMDRDGNTIIVPTIIEYFKG